MRLILHIGHPKCASTSLQKALFDSDNIFFPKSGLHEYEHLAIPLKLKGIDKWTSQWFSQDWVDSEFDKLVSEINLSGSDVVLSSERLVDITQEQLDFLSDLFPLHELELLLIYRATQEYAESMWKHAVFRHDLSEPYDKFLLQFSTYNPTASIDCINEKYTKHIVKMGATDWIKAISSIFDFDINLTRENISAPFECCRYLQEIHQKIGSKQFKKYFTTDFKVTFAQAFMGNGNVEMDEFDVPITGKNTS